MYGKHMYGKYMYGEYMYGEGKFVADGTGGHLDKRLFSLLKTKEALADLKRYECGVYSVYFPCSLFYTSVFSVSFLHTAINFQIW